MASGRASKSAFSFVEAVLTNFKTTSGLEQRLLSGLRLHDAGVGSVTLEMEISHYHTNRLNILHGGTIASIVDLGGSLAVASKGLFATGVSTDLNVTYLGSGGTIGDLIRVKATCDKLGKSVAFTNVLFYSGLKDSEPFARGSHTKYIAHAWSDSQNMVGQLTDGGDRSTE